MPRLRKASRIASPPSQYCFIDASSQLRGGRYHSLGEDGKQVVGKHGRPNPLSPRGEGEEGSVSQTAKSGGRGLAPGLRRLRRRRVAQAEDAAGVAVEDAFLIRLRQA